MPPVTDSEQFLIHYQDTDGQVKMNVVYMKEQSQFGCLCQLIKLTNILIEMTEPAALVLFSV